MRKDRALQIVETIEKLGKANVGDIVDNLPEKLSRQWVSTLLNKLEKEGKLLRTRIGRYVYYVTPENKHYLAKTISKKLTNRDLQEDKVLDEIKRECVFLRDLSDNVDSIFYYAFTEILNNAIEHSRSKKITVKVETINNKLTFEITDWGVGVFRNIKQKKKLKTELEAIQELLKGKTTTLPHSHSGEGIFFTSKIADVFILDSYGLRLRVDNEVGDIFIEEIEKNNGTKVTFEIRDDTKKHLNDVFEEYQSVPGSFSFDKTKVLVRLYTAGTVYISRSQARRLLLNLNKYKVVVLDFKGIGTIGQAFADEIFRVFVSNYPEIEVEPINMGETVEFMVKRAKKSGQLELVK